jgi:CDP-diacylglycerol pyrophosphatase
MNIKPLGVPEVKATQMRSIDEVAALICVCRGTVNNHIKAYDEAIAAGHKPPPGALKTVKWFGRRVNPAVLYSKPQALMEAPA